MSGNKKEGQAKRKVGRPKGSTGKKIDKAMIKVAQALKEAKEIQDKMSDKQRKLFVSLLKGYDPLKTCIDAGFRDFEGITKELPQKNGKYIFSSSLTMENVDGLEEESYAKLARICQSKIDAYLSHFNYREFLINMKDIIRFVAPEAVGTIVEIMQSGTNEGNRLRAAQDLLDRSGHIGERQEPDKSMPVQVNIIMDNKPKSEDLPIVNIEAEEGEVIE